MWLFPIAVVLAWIVATGHVLSRLGEVHVTLEQQRRVQQPVQQQPEQPVSSDQKLAKR